uniref:Uncharacterized protein n=1 Tax=Rhizophora mucronata TaxID=61149 RepID=A0A2P2MCS6_RHIMU
MMLFVKKLSVLLFDTKLLQNGLNLSFKFICYLVYVVEISSELEEIIESNEEINKIKF